jgi:ribosomal protein S12 methylthiotransferase accessory factor
MQSPAIAYPVAFGHWHLRGGTLQCRLPRRTVEVRAPAALLSEVARLCDGRLAWREVAAQLAQRWDEPALGDFLGGLCREGVLVESGELLAHWTDIGQAPALSPLLADHDELAALAGAADARLMDTPSVSATPLPAETQALAGLLRRRASQRTFGDEPLSAGALTTILWAAAGVTRAGASGGSHHRTVASGGNFHSLRWFVAVVRELPRDGGAAVEPGLHQVLFHVDGGCSLRALPGDANVGWSLLRDARVLQFASALVLPVAQVRLPARKYGNRAAVFAHIEAGQSLQNAQLMACALGAAGVVRGDTLAAEVARALAPSLDPADGPLIAMPAYVIGSAPNEEQVTQQVSDRWVDLHRLPRHDGAGGSAHAWSAGPIRTAAGDIVTVGRSPDPRLAVVKAEAEAWERLAWATLSQGGLCAPMADVEGAIDPRALACHSARQHRSPRFPFAPFDPQREHLWLRGHDAGTGEAVHVTADHVHALRALPSHLQARPLTSSSTSGVAAWSNAAQALERATLEVIERDAFVRSWIAGQPLPRLQAGSLPADAHARIRALESCGHRVAVLRLPTALAAVFAVFIQRSAPPLTAITAAADFDAEAALHKALDEAEGRASQPPAQGPASRSPPRTPHDIHRHWQAPNVFRRADWYASGPAVDRFASPALPACKDWSQLLQALRADGRRVLAIDITPTGAAIHQGRTPLHVMRAFIPGSLPPWFQHGLEPAGMPAYAAARAARRDRRGDCAPVPLHPFT